MVQLLNEFPQDVRVVYRHFPLTSIHDKAEIASQAAEAAGKQGKFFEYQKALFEKQQEWAGKSVDEFKTWLNDEAKTLGLDQARFSTDLTSQAVIDKVKNSEKDGEAINVPGTPYLVINGREMQVNPSYDVLKAIIQLNRMQDLMVDKCPDMTVDPAKKYTATLKTNKGDIVLELMPDKAPLAVNNFIFLARKGYYNNISFHRVLTGFVAQTGDPSETGFGGPGYVFGNEVNADLKFDKEGLIGMANSGPDSNGSQFFISYGPLTKLDGQYTIFGKVTSGMDVAKKLTPRDPSQGGELPQADVIDTIFIEEK